MNKELTPLSAFFEITIHPTSSLDEYFTVRDDLPDECNIVETALEEKARQDSILKILKEVIEFGKKLPHIEPNKDNGFDILSAVGIHIQRDIKNRERELLRQWVLETCFPKELKALEIIVKKGVDVDLIKNFDNYEDFNNYKFQYNKPLTQEEFDIIKEVLSKNE